MRYLAAEDSHPSAAALVPLLLQNECPVRARAVAELLAHSDRLSVEARVRVGLLPSEAAPVAIDSETAGAWFAELHGPFRAEAMAALEAQGLPAWVQLTNGWDKLGSCDQVWLLEWGSRECQHSIGPALEPGLSSARMRVLQAALETLSRDEIRDLYPSLLPLQKRHSQTSIHGSGARLWLRTRLGWTGVRCCGAIPIPWCAELV